MRVAILDDYQDAVRHLDCFARLADQEVEIWTDHVTDIDLLADRLGDAEALVLIRERTPVGGALLSRLERLKLISMRGSFPHVDVDECTRHRVLMCSEVGHGRPSYATAELTWGLIISAMRNLPDEVAALKRGRWQTTVGTGLRGRTLGVLGYGLIGQVVTGYAQAFGMEVLVWSGEESLALAKREGLATATSQEDLFEMSDVLTVHVGLNQTTRGLIGSRHFALMKPSSLFVNTSRAGLVEKGALEESLRRGRPGKAAVDVYDVEPIQDPSHHLLQLPNIICTPHLGYVEIDGYEKAFGVIFDQILAYEAGSPINVQNPEALSS
ncbi:MAG TPA: D-2-hydroxyacid dehydrogenase family protein [Acidimicrobiia bacterium]